MISTRRPAALAALGARVGLRTADWSLAKYSRYYELYDSGVTRSSSSTWLEIAPMRQRSIASEHG